MKRLLTITAILAAAATMAQAQTNQVLSRNAVGYVKLRIPAAGGYNLVAVNFNAIGGTNTTLADQLATQLRKGVNPSSVDTVYIYDPNLSSYVQYGVRSSDTQFHNKANFAGPATNPVIPSGQAFWLQSPVTATTDSYVYVMGEVPDFTNNLFAVLGQSGGKLQQLANPYPVDISIHQLINTNDGARASINPSAADTIYLWNSAATNGGYIQLRLRSTDNMWHYATNFSGPPPALYVGPGQGFWYQGLTNFAWNEIKPYTYP